MDNQNEMKNTGEIICSRIAQLRKRYNLSQEALARKLGITFQAVSKWENNVSCPDISIIPEIAGIFNVSVGYLFGEENKNTTTDEEDQNDAPENINKKNLRKDELESGQDKKLNFDWEDDNRIRIVIAKGHTILKNEEIDSTIKEDVNIRLEAEVRGCVIDSQVGITIMGDVLNSTLSAGSVINCGNVENVEKISAGDCINCGDITNTTTITAGVSVNCGDIGDAETVSAGENINCSDIGDVETVSAGDNINCGDITASAGVSAGEDITCGDLTSEGGNISAGGCIDCGDINDCGDITANTNISCSDINDCANITAGESISCSDINGCADITAKNSISSGDINN